MIDFQGDLQPMPLYKASFLTSDTRYGHSSSFVLKAPTNFVRQDFTNACSELVGKFCPLFGNAAVGPVTGPALGTTYIVGVRISQIGAKLVSLLLQPSDDGNVFNRIPRSQNPGWGADAGSHQFNASINVRVQSRYVPPVVDPPLPTVYSTTSIFIPGVPDAVIKNDTYIPGNVVNREFPDHRTAVTRFLRYLCGTANGQQYFWGHMGKDPATPVYNVSSPVAAADAITWTLPAHTINVGDLVQISHANSRGYNATLRVIAKTATSVTVQYRDIPPPPLPSLAKMRQHYNAVTNQFTQVVYDYITIGNEADPISISPAVRKAARPFNPVSFRRASRLPRSSR